MTGTGIRLTGEREALHLTKFALGAKSGVHPSRVGQIESGHVVPYDVELARLARALHFAGDPHELLEPCGEIVA